MPETALFDAMSHDTAAVRLFVLEGTQDDPDKCQRGNSQRRSADVPGRVGKLYGLVAEIIGSGAADRGDEVLPQMVSRNTLGALKEQHDQAGKDDDCRPVIGCFHRDTLQSVVASTTISANVAIIMAGASKINKFEMRAPMRVLDRHRSSAFCAGRGPA